MVILLCLLLIVAAGLAAFLVVGVVTGWKSVGFVPMPREVAERMVVLSGMREGERVIDLGSGDGRLVQAFARAGAQAEGVEMQWVLVWWSRAVVAARLARLKVARWRGGKVASKPVFYWGDLWGVDLGGYDVVVAYAFPRMMERLEEKFERELKPGAQVVLYTFPLPHWQPVRVEGKVFVYVKGALRSASPD